VPVLVAELELDAVVVCDLDLAALEELALIDVEPDDAELLSDVLALRSRTQWLMGRWDEAFSDANAAVAALDGLPESPQLARALGRLSQIEMLRHRDESIGHAEEAIAVARRVGDSFAEVNARINLFTEQATRGHAPDADNLIEIVERAAEVGVYEEAYRAIGNFLWSAPGYVPLDEVERVLVESERRLAGVTAPDSIGPYLDLSTAAILFLPASRWQDVDEIVDSAGEVTLNTAATRLVLLGLRGGLALRRGDLETAGPLIEELRPAALESGEPHRILPMACVALPWLHVSSMSDELRSLAEQVLTILDGRWPSVAPAVPIVRALAAAGEEELLRRTVDSMRRTPKEVQTAKLRTGLLAGEGLLALMEQRPAEAVELLTAAVEAERGLGYLYDAACLELDLARALEAHGDADAAEETRERAASVLVPLGCVNAF
jgi:tetratricopeptide (TPR) repeat protein